MKGGEGSFDHSFGGSGQIRPSGGSPDDGADGSGKAWAKDRSNAESGSRDRLAQLRLSSELLLATHPL